MRRQRFYVGDIRDDLDSETYPFSQVDTVDPLLEMDDEDGSGPPPPVINDTKTPIQDLIKEGQWILVQVAKDPLGTKGARLTTHISMPGRFIVYLPTVRHLGISRRIENDEERDRLRQVVQKLSPRGE